MNERENHIGNLQLLFLNSLVIIGIHAGKYILPNL